MIQRKIESKMLGFLDAKLSGNGACQHAKIVRDSRAVFCFAMEAMVGIRENGGNNKGPLVELIQETVGGHSGEAWCLSTVMTALAYAEWNTQTKSPLPATEHCMTLWQTVPKNMHVVSQPRRGAIAIYNYVGTSRGHTGVFLEEIEENVMLCVEGNTTRGISDTDEIVRDGGGVYLTKRSMIPKAPMTLVGFLKPF